MDFRFKGNAPDSVKNLIFSNPQYEEIKKAAVQEEKRLMYVAMTRPVESLILAVNQENGLLRLKQMGVNAVDSVPAVEKCDVLGINKNFTIENPADMNGWKFKTPESKLINLAANQQNYKKRDMQPSSCKSNSTISASIILDTGKRIEIKTENAKMDKVGTCIHNIFCVLENNPSRELITEIINPMYIPAK